MQILLLILAGALLLYRALGAAGVEALASWQAATRWALATLLLVTASAHFNRMREGLVRMVPGWVPNPVLTVYLTGVCEILGAIGILVPATRRAAGLALILFLVAVFPAIDTCIDNVLSSPSRRWGHATAREPRGVGTPPAPRGAVAA